MVFSSLTFIYAFLPVVAVLYFLLPGRRVRNLLLLAASLLFYSWGEPRFLPLILAEALTAYAAGLLMDKARRESRPRLLHAVYLTALALLIGCLFVCKYLGFAAENLVRLGAELFVPQLALPIGISFYTFQILSYLIDLKRSQVRAQRNFWDLALYVSFFPQLIAGPIVRYQTVEDQILHRRESFPDIVYGLRRFIIGLAKKVLLANNVAVVAQLVYAAPETFGSGFFWLAALAYTLQIYFDFSGYSDMAIGLGRIFGFRFPENFNYPYLSRSVTEFWRRWHISLSSWFRDYVYIPLGGSRVGRARLVLNILIVWGLTGFWHGASWNFVLWGLYYGLLLLAEKLFLQRWLQTRPAWLGWLVTFFLVNLGWVLFNLTDPAQLAAALRSMFCFRTTDWTALLTQRSEIFAYLLFLPPALLFCFPVVKKLPDAESPAARALSAAVCGVLLAASVICIISSSYNPFIYFRF